MTNKTTNKLIVVGALAVLLLGANHASAYVPGVWEPQPRVQNNDAAFTKVKTTEDAAFTPEKTVTTPITNNTTTTTTTNTTKTTPVATNTTKTTTNNTTTNKTYVASTNNTSSSNLPPVVVDQGASGFPSGSSNLSALSLQGSGGFLPSSIWQWLLVILLILGIVVIARTFKKDSHGGHVPAH